MDRKVGEMKQEELDGGRKGEIFLEGDVVTRPASSWSKSVHQLLTHLHNHGFTSVPKPLGFDVDGNEQVSFVDGAVHNSLITAEARSETALISAAQLLRHYHDATASFISSETIDLPWMLPSLKPIEVMCHGDYAPYNVAQKNDRVIGIFDFDTAHPAPRVWDVAYAVYRWAPLVGDHNTEGFGSLGEKIGRAKLFCDAYRLEPTQRQTLGEMIVQRLETMIAFMHAEAKAGNMTFAEHIREGHDQLYKGDIEFVDDNLEAIREGIR